MTDYDALVILLKQNNIPFRETALYDTVEPYDWCGYAIWLDVGHIELNKAHEIANIVNY